jgi:hypothetical protein
MDAIGEHAAESIHLALAGMRQVVGGALPYHQRRMDGEYIFW